MIAYYQRPGTGPVFDSGVSTGSAGGPTGPVDPTGGEDTSGKGPIKNIKIGRGGIEADVSIGGVEIGIDIPFGDRKPRRDDKPFVEVAGRGETLGQVNREDHVLGIKKDTLLVGGGVALLAFLFLKFGG